MDRNRRRCLKISGTLQESEMNFEDKLRQYDIQLRRKTLKILQINVGKFCNQTCVHCHVNAGPNRTEIMSKKIAERILDLLANTPSIEIVDFTGGAPELNPAFRYMIRQARSLGCRRLCNYERGCSLRACFQIPRCSCGYRCPLKQM